MPSEGVVLTRIAVDRRVWLAGKRRLDLSLRRLGNKLVLLGQMHEQRRVKPVDLPPLLLSVTPLIDDPSVHGAARARHDGPQPTQAIAAHSHPPRPPPPPRPRIAGAPA